MNELSETLSWGYKFELLQDVRIVYIVNVVADAMPLCFHCNEFPKERVDILMNRKSQVLKCCMESILLCWC